MQRPTIYLLATVAILGSLAAIFGCSASSVPGGTRIAICAKNLIAIPPIGTPPLPAKTPIHFSAGDKIACPANGQPSTTTCLPPGDYAYVNAEVFYYETDNDSKLDLTGSIDPNTGAYSAAVGCISGKGINIDMPDLSATIPYVTDLNIGADGTMSIRKQSLTFKIAKPATPTSGSYMTPPAILPDADKDYKTGSPVDTYTGNSDFTSVDQYLIDTNAPGANTHNYQIVSYLKKPIMVYATQQPGFAMVNVRVNLSLIAQPDRANRDDALKNGKVHVSPTPTPTAGIRHN